MIKDEDDSWCIRVEDDARCIRIKDGTGSIKDAYSITGVSSPIHAIEPISLTPFITTTDASFQEAWLRVQVQMHMYDMDVYVLIYLFMVRKPIYMYDDL